MNSFVTYERAAEGEPSAAPARWRRRLLAALLLALLTAATVSDADAKAEPLDPDESVLFLPSTARQQDGRIEVDLQAWIHEKDRHKILDAGLARYLGLKLSTLSPAARLRYAQPSSLFHAEPEEGTVLEIDFGQGTPHVSMPSSNAGGRTQFRNGEVARTRPERVEGVVIRDVTGEGRDAARYAGAFEGVASERWHIFRDGGS